MLQKYISRKDAKAQRHAEIFALRAWQALRENYLPLYTLIALILTSSVSIAQIHLPRLISDGAVLQRETQLTLWGWASQNESITLTFRGNTFSTTADAEGNWKIQVPAQAGGGPYELHFKGSNEITLKNILFGDVWICSGQSNMELSMERVKEKYPDVIANANNPNIREFLVADKYDFKKEHDDLDAGSWIPATSQSVLNFSAVAYFFANELYAKYQVPIGLINAALGGSPAEAWMSEDALKKFPEAYTEMQRFKDDNLIKEIEQRDQQNSRAWYRDLNNTDTGISKWHAPDWDDSGWEEMAVPGYWADGRLGNVNGSVWFRKKINIPASMTGKSGSLWIGSIVDADSVFVNGKFVGTTSYQYPPRRYSFGEDVLKPGENIISVRVINNAGRGGFVLDKPYFLAVGSDTIDLKGVWKYKQGSVMPATESQTFIRWKPGGLYNRMISPLLTYKIKGVIWYQGESNTRDPKQYKELFPALIQNWREKWNQGDFPFLYVQLANFMETKSEPTESNWAATRQAQLETLALPNTGMAVTIDVGEWNDIHPLNKEAVGKRLALAAQHVAYGDKQVVYSGPIYESHVINKNKVIISFTQTGSGLMIKGGGELRYFSIAGADKKFVWAKAIIENNKIVVWNDKVKKPLVVRYAWADNPESANLYNKEGLPASPFTTEK
jgi:sialate O-acetylesterase